MTTRIQVRRDTAANWTSVNPTLSAGEFGFETNTGKIKVGNGTSNWTSLAYLVDTSGLPIATTSVLGAVIVGSNLTVGVDGTISANVGLGANTFTGTQTGVDQLMVGWVMKDVSGEVVDKGSVGTGTVTFDYTGGSYQKLTVTGSLTIATSNWPPTGKAGSMLLEIVNGGSATITFPTINWVKGDGTTTTSFSALATPLQVSGKDFIVLWTSDAGTNIYGKVVR